MSFERGSLISQLLSSRQLIVIRLLQILRQLQLSNNLINLMKLIRSRDTLQTLLQGHREHVVSFHSLKLWHEQWPSSTKDDQIKVSRRRTNIGMSNGHLHISFSFRQFLDRRKRASSRLKVSHQMGHAIRILCNRAIFRVRKLPMKWLRGHIT